MSMVDPFDLSHNILLRVTELGKIRFIEALKQAAAASQKWESLSCDEQSNIWGIASKFYNTEDFRKNCRF